MKGRYLGHNGDSGGFRYEYRCKECGRTFVTTNDDESDPVLCHKCFTGERRGFRFVRKRPKGRRIVRKLPGGFNPFTEEWD